MTIFLLFFRLLMFTSYISVLDLFLTAPFDCFCAYILLVTVDMAPKPDHLKMAPTTSLVLSKMTEGIVANLETLGLKKASLGLPRR